MVLGIVSREIRHRRRLAQLLLRPASGVAFLCFHDLLFLEFGLVLVLIFLLLLLLGLVGQTRLALLVSYVEEPIEAVDVIVLI